MMSYVAGFSTGTRGKGVPAPSVGSISNGFDIFFEGNGSDRRLSNVSTEEVICADCLKVRLLMNVQQSPLACKSP